MFTDAVKEKSIDSFPAAHCIILRMSKIVVVKGAGGDKRKGLSADHYRVMLEQGLSALANESSADAAVRKYIPSGPVGMKTNCLARKLNSTPIALVDALTAILTSAGIDENDIVVWERSSAELERAGFKLNASSFGRRCFGTDTGGVGYSRDFFSFGKVNSLVSRVMTDIVKYNINLPVLKDHSIAGLSGGMKNMYGAINNPNKYHVPNCDPFAAHVSMLEPIREKNRLTIIDAVKVQYNAGPGYDSRHIAYYGGLIIGDDPVAVDRIGFQILEHYRKINGLPSLEKAGRPVHYLKSAEQAGLGVADINRIYVDVMLVDKDGRTKKGDLL
jgi:uncharacterized protein (DUF362 family)